MLEYMEIFIVNLIIPAVMLFGGYMMKTCPPRSISRWVGFRTALSMKNADTWAFAHACCGRVWWKIGWISLALSVLGQLPFAKAGEETLETLALVMVLAQSFVLLGTVVYVQRELKRAFDESGRRRQ